jgi:hypothetical protein
MQNQSAGTPNGTGAIGGGASITKRVTHLRRLPLACALVAAVVATLAAPSAARAGDFEFDFHFGDHRVPRVRTVRVVHTVHEHGVHCRYVEAHYEIRTECDVEPGYRRVVHRPAVYEVRRVGPCGERARVLVRPARRDRVWVPARTIEREVRVFVPGRWACGAC